jgi:glycosyltransferase involved in cell wall biosynthesis
VICSDIGGMAEKVQDGVSGLHFSRNDPESLAQVMLEASSAPELWNRLSAGVPRPYSMSEHVAVLREVYEKAEQMRRGPGTRSPLPKYTEHIARYQEALR